MPASDITDVWLLEQSILPGVMGGRLSRQTFETSVNDDSLVWADDVGYLFDDTVGDFELVIALELKRTKPVHSLDRC